MIPLERLAEMERREGPCALLRRGPHYFLEVGETRLSTEQPLALIALGELATRSLRPKRQPKIYIASLSLGFTTRGVLETLGSRVKVAVSEILPGLADWHHEFLKDLHPAPVLGDPRVKLVKAKPRVHLKNNREYDAILMEHHDEALERPGFGNPALNENLTFLRQALRPGGKLGFLSKRFDKSLTAGLQKHGFDTEEQLVGIRPGGRGARHAITIGSLPYVSHAQPG